MEFMGLQPKEFLVSNRPPSYRPLHLKVKKFFGAVKLPEAGQGWGYFHNLSIVIDFGYLKRPGSTPNLCLIAVIRNKV